jgi:hypothetical protein
MAVLVSMLLQPDGIDITSASEQDVADAVTRHVASYGSLFVDPAHEPSHGFKMREDLAVAALGAAKLVTSREPWIVRALLREWYDFEVINLWSFASNYFSLYLAPEEPLWLDSLALTNSFIHILVGVDFYVRRRVQFLHSRHMLMTHSAGGHGTSTSRMAIASSSALTSRARSWSATASTAACLLLPMAIP